MKPIEEQYSVLKGKSMVQPESQYKEKLKYNIDVEREYKKIQP